MNRQWLAYLAYFFVENKIKHVVVSPGSRNAPLLLHLTNYEELKVYTQVDERSAAFLALGMAQYLKSPVVLVCTSGSALLNYGPALSEAFYQQVPLLVLSADRPPEWLDQSDGQTIHQFDAFRMYIRRSFVLPVEIHHTDDEWFIWRVFSEAIRATRVPVPGPVHINIPFREPLYRLEKPSGKPPKIVSTLSSVRNIDEEGMKELLPMLGHSKKIMILAGQASPDPQTAAILTSLSRFQQVVVITDITSNQYNESFLRAADDIVASLPNEDMDQYIPDVLITIGGTIISKRLKLWLRKHPPGEHWHINTAFEAPDTFQRLTKVIPSEVNFFLDFLNSRLPDLKYSYSYNWKQIGYKINKQQNTFFEKSDFSDFKVCWKISQQLPRDSILHLANSMPVRYAHFFNWQPGVRICANRGVSGIDGCVSTAVGSALQHEGTTTLITGDLAMLYDAHGLWNTSLPKNLRIIVLNNGGGGIFSIIEGPGNFAAQREFFETPHHHTMKELAMTYGLTYITAHNEDELKNGLSALYDRRDKIGLLEIFTDREANTKVYRSYFEYINSNINTI